MTTAAVAECFHEEVQGFFRSARSSQLQDATAVQQEFHGQQDLYTKYAEDYDAVVPGFDLYRAHIINAAEAALILQDRKTAKILDFGAGTGLVADELIKQGYTNVDGIDCNKALLEVAQRKGCFKNIFLSKGAPSDMDFLFDNTYDMIVSAGTFFVTKSHPGAEFFEQMARVVKPGGHIVICTNEQYTVCEYNRWDVIQGLEARGVLQIQPLKKVPGYRLNKSIGDDTAAEPEAHVLVYKIC